MRVGFVVLVLAAGVGGCGEAPSGGDGGGLTLAPPPTPAALTATPGLGLIRLDWQPTRATSSYHLYWSTSPGATSSGTEVTLATTTYLHTGLANGVRYYYSVRAANGAGESPPSDEVSAVPAGSATSYTVGGVVGGLVGSGLELRLNGGETLRISGNGAFRFVTPIEAGAAYAVTIAAGPSAPAQRCMLLRASGAGGAGDVEDVEVVCSLQVATFNLEWFGPSPPYDSQTPDEWVLKQQGIAGVIRDAGFDVVAVQEVESASVLGSFVSTNLGPGWDLRLGSTGNLQRVGIVFRSDLMQVLDAGELDRARSGGIIDETSAHWDGWLRLPYFARLEVVNGGPTLDLVVLHLKAGSRTDDCATRQAQADDLASWLASREGGDVVVLGDFNDEIADTGICYGVDTLLALEGRGALTFLTDQPGELATDYYTNIPYRSTIDHILAGTAFAARVLVLDEDGHRSQVVMHGKTSLSDHQPPYVWLALD